MRVTGTEQVRAGTLTDIASSPKCAAADGGDCFAFRAPPRFARALATAGGARLAFLGFAPYSSIASLLDLAAARRLLRRAAGASLIARLSRRHDPG